MTYLVIGASGGIGQSLFYELKLSNKNVLGTYCSNESDFAHINQLRKLDVLSMDSIRDWISFLKKTGKLKNIVLINCIGINYNAFCHKSEIELWEKVIDINIKGSYRLIRSLLPFMRNDKFGRIINFSSVTTKFPTLGISAYITSKTAIQGLTKAIAWENGRMGITANVINLGYSNVGMGLYETTSEFKEKLINMIPIGRLCDTKEIFDLVSLIIKTQSMNGSCIDINGGMI